MLNKFPQFIERILSHEGGYVNDPRDPGGETKFGISKRSYPNVDIKGLTWDKAKDIYERDYWNPIVNLPVGDGVLYVTLDAAINSGVGNARRFLQRAVDVADDGVIGPVTQRALSSIDQNELLAKAVAERQLFQAKLSTWATYGKGWARRNAENLIYGTEANRD